MKSFNFLKNSCAKFREFTGVREGFAPGPSMRPTIKSNPEILLAYGTAYHAYLVTCLHGPRHFVMP